MPGFTPQEETLYRELEQRAKEQARALYARRKQDPVSEDRPDPAGSPRPREAPQPERYRQQRGGFQPPRASSPPRAANPQPRGRDHPPGTEGDREWAWLALVLHSLIRQRADTELIAAVLYVLLA